MSDFSNDIEDEIGDGLFNNDSPTIMPVSDIYIGAHTGDTGDNGGDNEVSASDYDRASSSPSDWSTSGNAPLTAENDNDIQFDTADSNWGTIEQLSLWDSETGGNCLAVRGDISSTSIDDNDRLIIEANDATFDID